LKVLLKFLLLSLIIIQPITGQTAQRKSIDKVNWTEKIQNNCWIEYLDIDQDGRCWFAGQWDGAGYFKIVDGKIKADTLNFRYTYATDFLCNYDSSTVIMSSGYTTTIITKVDTGYQFKENLKFGIIEATRGKDGKLYFIGIRNNLNFSSLKRWGGIYALSVKTGQFEIILEGLPFDDYYRKLGQGLKPGTAIAIDHKNRIWFGKGKGLFILDLRDTSITQIPDENLASPYVKKLFFDEQTKTMFISAGRYGWDGLTIINLETDDIQKIDHKYLQKLGLSINETFSPAYFALFNRWLIIASNASIIMPSLLFYDLDKKNFFTIHEPNIHDVRAIAADPRYNRIWVSWYSPKSEKPLAGFTSYCTIAGPNIPPPVPDIISVKIDTSWISNDSVEVNLYFEIEVDRKYSIEYEISSTSQDSLLSGTISPIQGAEKRTLRTINISFISKVPSNYIVKFRSYDPETKLTSNYWTREILIKIEPPPELPEPPVITDFQLYQNYPNPFNPSTTIEYDIPESVNVNLTIYNILGQKVRVLVNKRQEAGGYKVVWDGTDEFGNKVKSGIYFYYLKTEKYSQAKRMILLK